MSHGLFVACGTEEGSGVKTPLTLHRRRHEHRRILALMVSDSTVLSFYNIMLAMQTIPHRRSDLTDCHGDNGLNTDMHKRKSVSPHNGPDVAVHGATRLLPMISYIFSIRVTLFISIHLNPFQFSPVSDLKRIQPRGSHFDMSSKGHNVYAPGHKAVHTTHHEWRTAENSAAYLLPHLSKLVSQDPNIKLLDVGAGSGTITASLAKYLPEGQIVATDISGEVLGRAKAHAEKIGAHNIAFKEANIFELPFPTASFNVTHASQVLCHLDRPHEALAEMVRVTKPGGIVAIRETDMRTFVCWPDIKECYDAHLLIAKGIEHAGGSAEGGRQVISWALKAGVPRTSITQTFGTWTFSEPSDRKMWGESI